MIYFKNRTDSSTEIFRAVSRQPAVLPGPVNPSIHANWSSVMGIVKSNEAKAISRARNKCTESNNEADYLKFLNDDLEESSERFVWHFDNFTLLMLVSELEYFNSHIFVDGTFKG